MSDAVRLVSRWHGHPQPFGEGWLRGKCVYVHDGDTYGVELDLGFNTSQYVALRLEGYSSPELYASTQDEKLRASNAMNLARKILVGKYLRCKVHKRSFTRYVAQIEYYEDGAWIDMATKMKALTDE